MALETAKKDFIAILTSLKPDDRTVFMDWVQDEWYVVDDPDPSIQQLRAIAEDIKKIVPLSATFPSENISSENSEDNEPTLHVDSFLFEDDDIHTLVEEGKLSEYYCKKCLSTEVAPITFISHSASIDRVTFIFKHLVPRLEGKVLLDIGSRLGAMLYGAYFCSASKRIIGVEMNEDLCKVQRQIVEKYKMQDRVEVVCSDICDVPALIQEAEVILLNNVFEYFLSKEDQAKTWQWLRDHVTKPGTVLITVPSLEETLKKLETDIDLSSWVERIPIRNVFVQIKMEEQDLLPEICRYAVK